jgi:hypothetical protein
MTDRILDRAHAWGFVCDRSSNGNWSILPQGKAERWKLQMLEDRWLLMIGNVPQVSCRSEEVIAFLERRRIQYHKALKQKLIERARTVN